VVKSTAKTGKNDEPSSAIALPEVACPLGVYFAYPPEVDPGRRGGQETGFAVFDGTNLEPLDGHGNYVDMNGNGIRDQREGVGSAWQRLGLLKHGQKMNSAAYQSCVTNAAAKLVTQGLLPAKVGAYYTEKSATTRLPN
jgi:hypothetical protein